MYRGQRIGGVVHLENAMLNLTTEMFSLLSRWRPDVVLSVLGVVSLECPAAQVVSEARKQFVPMLIKLLPVVELDLEHARRPAHGVHSVRRALDAIHCALDFECREGFSVGCES